MNRYAQVVLGLAVEGPFDYRIPDEWQHKLTPGVRVLVDFHSRKSIAYVVGLSKTTRISRTKKILRVLDEQPLLDKALLRLSRAVADYYCSPWGEVIETSLPLALRRNKPVGWLPQPGKGKVPGPGQPQITLVHDPGKDGRWEVYAQKIRRALDAGMSCLILLPDTASLRYALIELRKRLAAEVTGLLRNKPGELKTWCRIKEGAARCLVSTRSGIFAPCRDLGLIIVDEEQASSYKQEQSPHYHTRDVALMRSRLEKADLVFGSTAVSLEMYRAIRKKKIEYLRIRRSRSYPQVQMINMRSEYARITRKREHVSRLLQDYIASALAAGGKVLLYYNKKGFATYAACHNCGQVLRCARCESNLVFHYRPDLLSCRHCAYTMKPPRICPRCRAGYIRYTGAGSEKIESELGRIFPQARVGRIERASKDAVNGADIYVATSSVARIKDARFDLVGILTVDRELNRVDFRAGEKTYAVLAGLLALAGERYVIQTNSPRHRVFEALRKDDAFVFLEEELKARRQLKLPPCRHHILVKFRGAREQKAKAAAERLAETLKTQDTGMEVVGVYPGQPPKVRGNYYWQVLLNVNTRSMRKYTLRLKPLLKESSSSGIIVTADVDPV
ncbi:MAG: primosomal protein N' [Candidatus Omnitrophica bacterium]|nr:primosomal protein N' [Candidatus Omnitrophota bacterium]